MASAKRKSAPGDELVLEEFLPYRLSILSNRISRAIAARYAETFNLTIPEWRIIAVLGRAEALSAKDIAEATEMDKVAVSRAVARLVAAKRVAARADRADARRQNLSLTREGESVYARIAPIALASERKLLAALDARERAQLDALLDRLLSAARSL
ncbi:MarR family winged helix-turn-helix transcriptional regulator [Terricaulis sp.]|uniref:MarR family winged helix-turn-helix transcriptional regulator n=1 Tax=Terricaulis sp. TaxID=2768686 RepID=UPI002AC577EC|nr:MarR family winged helix-turn-helix transcriptional regulator [Terricaulis sp.]MDZ4692301.1 MarR family winged helix-turn-helix transcriptional regulator [Terricaulis sp.]